MHLSHADMASLPCLHPRTTWQLTAPERCMSHSFRQQPPPAVHVLLGRAHVYVQSPHGVEQLLRT